MWSSIRDLLHFNHLCNFDKKLNTARLRRPWFGLYLFELIKATCILHIPWYIFPPVRCLTKTLHPFERLWPHRSESRLGPGLHYTSTNKQLSSPPPPASARMPSSTNISQSPLLVSPHVPHPLLPPSLWLPRAHDASNSLAGRIDPRLHINYPTQRAVHWLSDSTQASAQHLHHLLLSGACLLLVAQVWARMRRHGLALHEIREQWRETLTSPANFWHFCFLQHKKKHVFSPTSSQFLQYDDNVWRKCWDYFKFLVVH